MSSRPAAALRGKIMLGSYGRLWTVHGFNHVVHIWWWQPCGEFVNEMRNLTGVLANQMRIHPFTKTRFHDLWITRLCFQHLCLPFRPLPYLNKPIKCRVTLRGWRTRLCPDCPPPFCPFRSRAQSCFECSSRPWGFELLHAYVHVHPLPPMAKGAGPFSAPA